MSLEGWAVFAAFRAPFVTTPRPNAVNRLRNGGPVLPTALTITAERYRAIPRSARGSDGRRIGVMIACIRRAMGACFVVHGALLGGSGFAGRPA